MSDEITKTLRLAYRDKLLIKINEAIKQWDNLVGVTWQDEQCKAFYKMIHQFNGSSGSYGYLDVSNELSSLEMHVKALMDQDGKISAEEHMKIKNKLDEINNLIKAILASDEG